MIRFIRPGAIASFLFLLATAALAYASWQSYHHGVNQPLPTANGQQEDPAILLPEEHLRPLSPKRKPNPRNPPHLHLRQVIPGCVCMERPSPLTPRRLCYFSSGFPPSRNIGSCRWAIQSAMMETGGRRIILFSRSWNRTRLRWKTRKDMNMWSVCLIINENPRPRLPNQIRNQSLCRLMTQHQLHTQEKHQKMETHQSLLESLYDIWKTSLSLWKKESSW